MTTFRGLPNHQYDAPNGSYRTDAIGLVTVTNTADITFLLATGVRALDQSHNIRTVASSSLRAYYSFAEPVVMASAPTVTVGTDAAASTVNGNAAGTLSYGPDDAALTYVGTIPGVAGTSVSARYRTGQHLDVAAVGSTTYASGPGWGVQFMTDATKFEFDGRQIATADATYRIWVDGQLVQAARFAQVNGGTAGGQRLVKVDFSALTPARKPRKIFLEFGANFGFGGINVQTSERIWKAPVQGPMVAFIGDSITDGTAGTGADDSFNGSTGFPRGGYVYRVSSRFGWEDVWKCGKGSTGYVNPGNKSKFGDKMVSDLQRIVSTTGRTFDIIYIAGGINDNGYNGTTTAQMTAAVTAFVQQVRAAFPQAVIIALGTWIATTNGATYTPAATWEAAIMAGVAALQPSDPLLYAIDTYSPAPWETGTGNYSVTAGNGNNDFYMSTNNPHPTPDGHKYLGDQVALTSLPIMQALAYPA